MMTGEQIIGELGSFDDAAKILQAWRDGMAPEPALLVSDWADKHRMLGSRGSAEPGPWRSNRTPYLRDVMDALSPAHPARRVVFMKGAQVGGTECGNNWIGYRRRRAGLRHHDGWNAHAKGWNAGAVMADSSLNRRQTIRVGAGVAFAQVGIVGFDGQIELEALRLFGLPEAAPAVLYACPSVPIGTRSLALETTWDLPSLTAGSTANIDVTVPGARRGDFADASLDTSSIAFVLDCHVWSNNSVRVTARNVSASTVDLAAAPLAVQVVKRRAP